MSKPTAWTLPTVFSTRLPRPADAVDRGALALAEALIPSTTVIPLPTRPPCERPPRWSPGSPPRLATAWSARAAALDAAARLRTGRPFHTLSAARQDALLSQWERDPLLRVPLSLVSNLYKIVHFDAPHVQRAMGAKPKPPLEVTEPRWTQQVHPAESWTGGDVDCDVVVVGTGAGGAVVGHELAQRGHAVVFVEEGHLYHRHSFDGSTVRSAERFYRPALALGNAAFPVFLGRLVGGSTAVNGGTAFRTPPWVLERWCEEMGTDDFLPSRMGPYFERVEKHLGIAPSSPRHVGPIADVFRRGCDALGWKHGYLLRNAPGCEASGSATCCRTEVAESNVAYVPPALEGSCSSQA
jgi:hypothetical protein